MEATQALRGGVSISFTGVETDYRLRCPSDCRHASGCLLRRLAQRAGGLDAQLTLVSLTIANASEHLFPVNVGAWELVDTQGFAMGGAAMCEPLLPVNHVQADLWSVSPGTRVRTVLAFPAQASERQIHALLYAAGEEILRFELHPLEGAARELQCKPDDARAAKVETPDLQGVPDARAANPARLDPDMASDARPKQAEPLRLVGGSGLKRLHGEQVLWFRKKKKHGKRKKKIRVEECYSIYDAEGEKLYLAIGRKPGKKKDKKKKKKH